MHNPFILDYLRSAHGKFARISFYSFIFSCILAFLCYTVSNKTIIRKGVLTDDPTAQRQHHAAGRRTRTHPAAGSGRDKTMAYQILRRHHRGPWEGQLHLTFDSLISHDITYVGIIQTAKASGLRDFPVPYVLTNCHNSLCAVGGTINEDDHAFGLSAAVKYGGNYVPANQAVIHQYAREMMSGCGRMILGSDSHTRYGALGTMGVGEGGPEIVKQLLKNTYDIAAPQVVLVWLTGTPPHGVGPHDVAIALCGAVYGNGFAKKQNSGICRPRRDKPAHGLPHRHRRNDHGDGVPVLHLADGRCRGGVPDHPRTAGGLYPAGPGGGRLL